MSLLLALKLSHLFPGSTITLARKVIKRAPEVLWADNDWSPAPPGAA